MHRTQVQFPVPQAPISPAPENPHHWWLHSCAHTHNYTHWIQCLIFKNLKSNQCLTQETQDKNQYFRASALLSGERTNPNPHNMQEVRIPNDDKLLRLKGTISQPLFSYCLFLLPNYLRKRMSHGLGDSSVSKAHAIQV